ncbi:MAG: hypothetical protein QM752_02620 [Gammaproteobacteria bacterium]
MNMRPVILQAILDEALPPKQYDALMDEVQTEQEPKNRLRLAAKIARALYDAEKAQMAAFRGGASLLTPEFKKIEQAMEQRRYLRQEETIQTIAKDQSLSSNISLSKARDILWALTGRDMYRMLVIERSWKSEEYENWLGDLLINLLII